VVALAYLGAPTVQQLSRDQASWEHHACMDSSKSWRLDRCDGIAISLPDYGSELSAWHACMNGGT
jgi:hypothetical protein